MGRGKSFLNLFLGSLLGWEGNLSCSLEQNSHAFIFLRDGGSSRFFENKITFEKV